MDIITEGSDISTPVVKLEDLTEDYFNLKKKSSAFRQG
jgi:hypothetical protein